MKAKIGICIAIAEAILPAAYFNHIEVLRHWTKKYPLMIFGTQRVKVCGARALLTKKAIEHGCTHILFVDSDHIIPVNMLELFMENADAAMVSGLIVRRAHPFNVVAFVLTEDGDLIDAHIKPDTGVHELAVCAMGCTLLNLELLQKLEKPWWFDNHFRSDINLGLKFQKELGAKVLVDSRVVTGHIGDPPVIFPGHVDTMRAYDIGVLMHELEAADKS